MEQQMQAANLTAKVYRKIRKEILRGTYKPGQSLTELALTKSLEVSRTPVREALRQLEMGGLVELRPNRGALVSLFSQLLDSRNGFYYTVKALTVHNGGIAGVIGNDSVLVGTLECMQNLGIDLADAKPMDQAVYTAIDGQVCGVFAVSYQKSRSTMAGLRTLCGCPGLAPMVVCDDFMLSKRFVQAKFGINPRRMTFPSREMRQDLGLQEVTVEDPVIALTTKEGLAPKAFAVTGARVLRSAMKTGVAVHMVGGILGLLMMLVLAFVGPQGLLTPWNILLYELIWMVPGLLITEWTRVI